MKAIKLLPLLVPFVVPPIFHAAYQPINCEWTVETFGCGCPPLGGGWRFNANHFNTVLWLIVGGGCVSLWNRQIGRLTMRMPENGIMWLWVGGIGVISWLVLRSLLMEIWF